MKIFIVLASSVLASACVVNEAPVVQACLAKGDAAPAPSGGALRILPSEVPGVTISSASWQVRGETTDGAPVENLYLSSTLHSEGTVPQQEIALVYDAPGPHANVDELLLEKGVEAHTLGANEPFLTAGGHITVEKGRQLRSAYQIGPQSALPYCPRTVRVVPWKGLALALAPDLLTQEGQAVRLRKNNDTAPLVVMMDSVLKDGLIDGFVVGAALNTTDTILKDMVVGLVTSRDTVAQDGGSQPSADTLEYYVGSVAPHNVAPFAGGSLNSDERIVARIAYHPTDVRGRLVARDPYANRASQARRVNLQTPTTKGDPAPMHR